MRQLTEQELRQVQQAMIKKDITSAELLMEIYDHYISHLERFSEDEFKDQLFELEQKFSYSYCHALQYKFNKSAKKEIGKVQWQVIRSYFCTSRWIFALGIFGVIFYCASQASTKQEIGLLFLSPLILLSVMMLIFNWRVYRKTSPIKKAFKGIKIQSSTATPFGERIYLPVLLAQLVFSVPKIFPINFLDKQILFGLTALSTSILTIYMLSLLEAWKIKSKTALI
jgi:hypothetical protein